MEINKYKRHSEITEARQHVNVQPEDTKITKTHALEIQNKHVRKPNSMVAHFKNTQQMRCITGRAVNTYPPTDPQ